ncbi:MAG: sialidase family protein [Acidimicrobiaceae bacterium]
MRRNFLLGLVIASVTVISLGHSASAVFVDPNQRDCLNRKFGTKAAAAISKAKKLTTAQAKQVSACSGPGGQSSSGGASGSSGSSSSSLTALSWGLMWSVGSNQAGLGNVSDPALLQLGDGSLRMFFKNGNSPQVPLSGFDNKIHSYVSSDNGATWTLESGVRIDVGSPVTVRAAEAGGYEAWGWIPGGGGVEKMTRFTSSTGKDFSQGSGSLVPTSACKNADGSAAGLLGDPQVVKVASGYLAYAQEMAAGKSAPFKRQACKLTSADGNTWSIDSSGTFAFNYDIRNNPELYRNSAGQLELWFSADGNGAKNSEIRTSSNDGASWSTATSLSWIANDPERLDLANGTSLLAFGNFDQRRGGLLAVSKKISTGYAASRDEKVDQVSWVVSGAKQADIKVKNLCLDKDLTSSATFGTSGPNVTVTLKDSSFVAAVGCAYILVGSSQAIS